jgi:hypothetical protein
VLLEKEGQRRLFAVNVEVDDEFGQWDKEK